MTPLFRMVGIVVVLALALLAPTVSWAGPLTEAPADVAAGATGPAVVQLNPDNDQCSGATPIYMCSDTQLTGDSQTAVNDYDPGPSCTGRPAPGKDIVFAIEMHTGFFISVSYQLLQGDAAMYVVTDCGYPAWTCLMGVDQSGVGETEYMTFTAPGHDLYYLILDAAGTDEGGPWTFECSYPCFDFPEACCFADGHCEYLWWDECAELGGQAMGGATDCVTTDCAATPAERTTWGRIKSTFR